MDESSCGTGLVAQPTRRIGFIRRALAFGFVLTTTFLSSCSSSGDSICAARSGDDPKECDDVVEEQSLREPEQRHT